MCYAIPTSRAEARYIALRLCRSARDVGILLSRRCSDNILKLLRIFRQKVRTAVILEGVIIILIGEGLLRLAEAIIRLIIHLTA